MSANTALADFVKKPLPEELAKFRGRVEEYKSGNITAEQFKAARTVLGIYSQRQAGLYMVRTKFPAGVIGPQTLSALADAADSYGGGKVHLTTRQDFQFHFVALDDLADILEDLHHGGITTLGAGGNTMRNITVCDHAGTGVKEPFDVTEAARVVSEYFLTRPISKGLPRKFKITFCPNSENCGAAYIDDFVAVAVGPEDGYPGYGFSVYAGGGQGAIPSLGRLLEDFVPADRIHLSINAALNVFNKNGTRTNRNRARLRFLIERIGFQEFAALYRQELQSLPETESLGWRPPGPEGWRRSPANSHVLLKVPVGDLSSGELRTLGGFLAENPSLSARVTKNADILITGVRPEELDDTATRIREIGFRPVLGGPGHVVRSCNGAVTCSEGITNSKGLARVLESIFQETHVNGTGPLTISLSGCVNSCALHHTADIGLSGAAKKVNGRLAPHYQLYVGGHPKGPEPRLAVPITKIPAKNAPDALKRLAALLSAEKRDGESVRDIVDRIGPERVREELSPFTGLPSYEEEREAYLDWESNEDFNLDDVGPGECAGSVLEIIDAFFAQARRELETAKAASESGGIIKAVSEGAEQAAKALLVPFGIEPASVEETRREFRNKLITRGFVSERFDTVLLPLDEKENAGVSAEDWLRLYEEFLDEADSALERINSKGASSGEKAQKSEAVERMDLSGVACPFNYIKIKLKLEGAPLGTRLEAVLDDGSPIKNVPRSLDNDGQKVLSIDKLENGQYLILVEKAA